MHTLSALRRVMIVGLWLGCISPLSPPLDSAPAKNPTLDDIVGSIRDVDEVSLANIPNLPVKTAAKHDQELGQAPASVTVVTAAEIAGHGYETLADVLRGAVGFYVVDDRNYEYVGVRGFSPPGDLDARVLFLLDGHPLNDNDRGTAGLGADGPIDLAREIDTDTRIVNSPAWTGKSAFVRPGWAAGWRWVSRGAG